MLGYEEWLPVSGRIHKIGLLCFGISENSNVIHLNDVSIFIHNALHWNIIKIKIVECGLQTHFQMMKLWRVFTLSLYLYFS